MADILIADDDQLLIDLLRFRLERKGHSVRSCSDGEQTLEDVAAKCPDLILIDYQIPARSIQEIIETLKSNEQTRNVPVLVLASQWREEDVLDALKKGITDYIVKPFAPEELLLRIERALT